MPRSVGPSILSKTRDLLLIEVIVVVNSTLSQSAMFSFVKALIFLRGGVIIKQVRYSYDAKLIRVATG